MIVTRHDLLYTTFYQSMHLLGLDLYYNKGTQGKETQ